MNQKVLENSQEVSYQILQQVKKAQKEILIAVTYFTSKNIFEKLVEKAKHGVKIIVVLDDNRKNRRLDFDKLSIHHTAEVIKEKMDSSDTTNKKFCVFDRKVLIEGLFELKDSPEEGESATITNEYGTVESFLKTFFKNIGREDEVVEIEEESNRKKRWFRKFRLLVNVFNKNKANNPNAENGENTENEEEEGKSNQPSPSDKKIENTYDVDEELSSIVSSEVKKIDRKELNEEGYDGAKKVNGDANVLEKTMDTLFHLFVTDKNNVEERKKGLKQKIKDKSDSLEEEAFKKFTREQHLAKEDILALEKEFTIRQNKLDSKILSNKEDVKQIEDIDIVKIQEKIDKVEDEINELDLNFVKTQPTRKRFVLIPLIILTVALGIGLFLFYSSCAYILFYLEKSIYTGGNIKNISIFVPNSLHLSWNAGGIFALIYSALFFAIPYAIGFVWYESKSWKKYMAWGLIFAIDALIALNVSKALEKVSGSTNLKISYTILDADKITEYVTILFLGFIPMIILVELTKKIIHYFRMRNKDEREVEKDMKKEQLTNKVLQLENEMDDYKIEIYKKDKEIHTFEGEKNFLDIEIEYLPRELKQKLNDLEMEKDNEIRYIQKKRDFYVNAVDNDSIRISLEALKDRVNIYLDGWNKWLHEEFSRKVAVEYSKDAREVCDDWMKANSNTPDHKNNENTPK